MNTREFQFQSGGCKCNGWYYVPDDWGPPAKLPLLVIVPGGMGFVSKPKAGDLGYGLVELAKRLADAGFVCCGFDGRGQGQSEGLRTGHDLAIEDLEAALAYLRESCEAADGNRIGLFGQSLGGMASVVVATRDDGIRSLILWGTLPRYSIWKAEQIQGGDGTMQVLWDKVAQQPAWQGKTIEEFFRSFRTFDPIELIHKLSLPILFAGGSADSQYFIPEQQTEFFETSTSEQVMFLRAKGEPHRIRHPSPMFSMLAVQFAAWFKETV